MALQLRHFFRRASGPAGLASARAGSVPASRETVAGSSAEPPRGTATVRDLRMLIPVDEAAPASVGADTLVLLPMSALASGRMRLRELWECAPFLFRGEVAAVDAREVVLGGERLAPLQKPGRTDGLWSRFAELGEPLAAAALQVPPGGSPGRSQDGAGRNCGQEQKPAERVGPVEVATLLGSLPGVRACALWVAGAGSGAGGDAGISRALQSALPQTETALHVLAAGLAMTGTAVVTMHAGEEARTVYHGNGVLLVVAHRLPELPEQTAAQCLAAVRRLAPPG